MKGISILLLGLIGCASHEPKADPIRDALNSKYDEYRLCYKKSPLYENKTRGVLTVEFMIDQKGKVSHLDLLRSDFKDKTFHECILKEIGQAQFTPSQYPEGTHVTQPYTFGP